MHVYRMMFFVVVSGKDFEIPHDVGDTVGGLERIFQGLHRLHYGRET